MGLSPCTHPALGIIYLSLPYFGFSFLFLSFYWSSICQPIGIIPSAHPIKSFFFFLLFFLFFLFFSFFFFVGEGELSFNLCCLFDMPLKKFSPGLPGWLRELSIWLLISAQVLNSGSWVLAPCWAYLKKKFFPLQITLEKLNIKGCRNSVVTPW